MGFGSLLDYGTPAGWASMAGKKLGINDSTMGEGVDSFLAGANRANVAEGRYGGVDRNNYNVPGYGQSYGQYGNLAGQYGGRSSPYAGQMEGLASQYAREAGGNGIGQRLIRGQAQGMADRGTQQQLSMAASARPGQSGLAYRSAAMNAGNMNSQVGGQSAQAMGNYQLGAMQGYGQQLSQMDDARLRQLGLNDSSQLAALQQRLQLQNMQQQGGMNYENNRTQRYGALMGAPTQNEQLLGGLMGLGGAYLGMK